MTVRKMRIVCWLLAVVCTAGAVAVIALAVLWPVEQPRGQGAGDSPVKKKPVPRTTPVLTMAEFEPLMTGRLRPAPPQAPPPPPQPVASIVETAPVPPPAPQAVGVQLLGTVVEGGNNYGMFQTDTGVE